jgi:hypothetical protein
MLAVSITVCVVPVHCEVAVKAAVVAWAATVTAAGTATIELLLERLTLTPPVGAAESSVTVQASVLEPAMYALSQETALKTGDAVAATAALRSGTVPPQPDTPSRRLKGKSISDRLARLDRQRCAPLGRRC